jgi:fatty acid desaturase
MSLEDLERVGVTLPRDQWGKRDVRSAVNKPLFLASVLLAVVAAVLMYFGNGQLLTWLGAILFIAALFGATALALHATVSARAR